MQGDSQIKIQAPAPTPPPPLPFISCTKHRQEHQHWFLIGSLHCLRHSALFSTHTNASVHICTQKCTHTVHHRDFLTRLWWTNVEVSATPLPKEISFSLSFWKLLGSWGWGKFLLFVIFEEFLRLWVQSGIWARGVDGFHLSCILCWQKLSWQEGNKGTINHLSFQLFFGPHMCQLIC